MVARIVFDLDDTLINTGARFAEQLRRFHEHVRENLPETGPLEQTLELHDRVDREHCDHMGITRHRFPISLEKTWRTLCRKHDRAVRDRDLHTCLEIGYGVFERVPDPVDGMTETLRDLAPEYELILYTMGEPEVQRPKIRYHQLEQWFSEIHIVPWKDVSTLRDVVRPHAPGYVLIVGDSPRAEIQPALELGVRCVHRVPDRMWSLHEAEIDETVPSIRSLTELFEYLP